MFLVTMCSLSPMPLHCKSGADIVVAIFCKSNENFWKMQERRTDFTLINN
ncbi:putative septum formation initiator [Prevotella intermedia ZT]|uniref:Septum formation initiator n=1 Tax=Prevotella intermedia ZT TaxID=1347790 RepID=A0AAP0VG34_PREIN|nr:putative septum formation initiator [Prevotella intermedia ZT]